MILQTSTLIPGLLVSLKSSVRGNVSYAKRDLGESQEGAAIVTKWETERTVRDTAEQERAIKVRSKARSLIVNVCAQSSFGLLCPETRAADLETAFEESRRLVAEFNRTANLTQIGIYIVAGRIAADDVQAVRSINSEIRDLMESMQQGLRDLDAGVVREACNKARALGSMLAPEAGARVKNAIDVARKAARDIVKAGEAGAVEIDQAAIHTIKNARTAFLDLEDETETQAPEASATRTMDLDAEVPTPELQPYPDMVEPEPEFSLPDEYDSPAQENVQPDEPEAPSAPIPAGPAPARFAFDLED